ncbi:MAG: methylmalonyl-CoA mutase [Deltaproteobacteria bacterium CG12_big_fil_rev_8_21_14_0_65_43_10]|nr:MAG: methylmalonyl-CoA mutase [Deltaproteobacteria bacterium CG2_30_43_15]PIQ44720.1 MAG: methylmalonyl-CoA mutase [Deltaproteobacteria bacterium CG12_big_fil_rev_8_21_14_0_65_43_10]PIU86189.1 MAG: methylmalonyl-CoA mutase [Deltaproteobacteria bacterium CG06_land_8_20_14_3_00_44_19]PIZ19721.1 MAG: methylmalonyl-CoA mutase [Deltaproteobacteria bacterium CG_4_10_14_0_8_um_filter_43_12]PJB42505.1 MAG: methylmalonyl-CoA mutase [Deltaproteobacteria bacterium CG_4_9_14_3_um_filter_44_9]HCX90580.1
MFREDEIIEIKRDREKWEEKLEKGLAKAPEINERFSTVSDMEIGRLYTPEDIQGFDFQREMGFPGEYPFTRGVQPSMYRGRHWTMRMFSGFGSAEDTNKRYHYLLSQGQTGLSVAFHMPTLMGYDSDSPLARGEVGKCGVAIDTLKDMEILFHGIPLDQVTTSMTINPPAAILLAMYIAVAEKQGVNKKQIGGTIQNDMLKEFIAQKTFMCPPKPSVRVIVDTIEYCTKEVPLWNTISISGYHIREAGSTAVQELAFTLADGIGYVQAAIERGLDVDSFAPRLSFFFNAHIDFFEEIAKYRAARRIWARVMKERFKAKNPRSWLLRFHTQTAGCSLTAQQPYNNVVRTAFEALAAVLGGTQSLHTNSLDEVLALPSEESATIALRTQQIIAEETGVTNTIDPLGGSYFVESLTNRMEEDAMEYINKIDEMGGIIEAIERGYPQNEIAKAAYHYQEQIDREEKAMVGVNKYVMEEIIPIETLKISPDLEEKQIARTGDIKENRDNGKVNACLDKIRSACEGNGNVMPPILDAVKEYATLQEICDVFREVFGVYRDPGMF